MAAIRECAIENVPTIGIIDSNVDPRIVMYAIPANDESTRTAELIAGVLSIAGREGAEIWYQQQAMLAGSEGNVEMGNNDQVAAEPEYQEVEGITVREELRTSTEPIQTLADLQEEAQLSSGEQKVLS